MRTFLLRLGRFLVPGVLLAYPLDLLLSYALVRSHDYPGEMEVWRDIHSDTLAVDLAIHGSSRAWVHMDPRILQDTLGLSVYNFGVDGQGFRVQYIRHAVYAAHDPAPRYILMAADIHNLRPKHELYGAEQFLPYLLWNDTLQHYLQPFEAFEDADFRVPLLRFAGREQVWASALRSLLKQGTPLRHRGFAAMDRAWQLDMDSARTAWRALDVTMDPALVSLFERFLDTCAERNIRVILVNAPEYIEFQRTVPRRDAALAVFRELAARKGLVFLDYSDDPLCRDRSLFYNATHLNRAGAERFSARLAHDLKLAGVRWSPTGGPSAPFTVANVPFVGSGQRTGNLPVRAPYLFPNRKP